MIENKQPSLEQRQATSPIYTALGVDRINTMMSEISPNLHPTLHEILLIRGEQHWYQDMYDQSVFYTDIDMLLPVEDEQRKHILKTYDQIEYTWLIENQDNLTRKARQKVKDATTILTQIPGYTFPKADRYNYSFYPQFYVAGLTNFNLYVNPELQQIEHRISIHGKNVEMSTAEQVAADLLRTYGVFNSYIKGDYAERYCDSMIKSIAVQEVYLVNNSELFRGNSIAATENVTAEAVLDPVKYYMDVGYQDYRKAMSEFQLQYPDNDPIYRYIDAVLKNPESKKFFILYRELYLPKIFRQEMNHNDGQTLVDVPEEMRSQITAQQMVIEVLRQTYNPHQRLM